MAVLPWQKCPFAGFVTNVAWLKTILLVIVEIIRRKKGRDIFITNNF
jgi:hypothetical protein